MGCMPVCVDQELMKATFGSSKMTGKEVYTIAYTIYPAARWYYETRYYCVIKRG